MGDAWRLDGFAVTHTSDLEGVRKDIEMRTSSFLDLTLAIPESNKTLLGKQEQSREEWNNKIIPLRFLGFCKLATKRNEA